MPQLTSLLLPTATFIIHYSIFYQKTTNCKLFHSDLCQKKLPKDSFCNDGLITTSWLICNKKMRIFIVMKHLKREFEQYLPVDWLFSLDLQDLMANMEPLVTYGYLNLSKIFKDMAITRASCL